ncbi:malonic semialdehyde reductase [Altericroceibacterium spongiae]|uniref:Putative NADH dehydrogenase/NAD(P)H nitroreductase D6851_07420 n=1 Tax=Altericroceibacterium spongiae TaxID=2320269 RepID=A0A420EMG6_9SPHN|nr:malonic semialdehyde reductase [Altericroceibacterium spongiae]RKF21840.1 malonic semialdehyde reductase [Altericroceibacterium spongiae]
MSTPLSDAALDQLFREARTYNGYLDRPVNEEQLHQLWDLLKMGPTSANQLPARIIWCTSPEARERLAAHVSASNKPKLHSAPVCAIVAMDIDFHEQLPWLFPHADAKSWFANDEELRKLSALRNSTLQGAYLILAARALGLDCGPMSGFDNEAVDKDFLADHPRWKSNFLCTIGYGDRSSIFQRSPRPDFDTFNSIL